MRMKRIENGIRKIAGLKDTTGLIDTVFLNVKEITKYQFDDIQKVLLLNDVSISKIGIDSINYLYLELTKND